MKSIWRLGLIIVCSLLLIILLISSSEGSKPQAEKWPTRPITIVVGYAPGGGMDIMSRALAEEMRKTLGVAIAVTNMPGANGAVALEYVSKQPKDGYTLYAVSSATSTYPATGVSKLTYKDFGLIGIAFKSVPLFSVPKDSAIKSTKDLIEGLKKGNLTGANSGIGGMWHVPQVVVADTVGGKFTAVPYEGGAPAALAAAKKEVDFATSDVAEAQTLLREKMLTPLCVVADKPFNMEGVGTIPPITDFVPEIKDKLAAAAGWRALGYPRGVPEDRVKKLIEAFKIAMDTEAIKEFAKKSLLISYGVTGEEADKIWTITTQVQSWLLYDLKEARRSPEEVGIPRYKK